MNTLLGLVLMSLMLFTAHGFMFPSSRELKLSVSMLKVGDVAPDFELKNYRGKAFKLSSFKGKKPVVVFFYPADNTPGCTTEVSGITFNRLFTMYLTRLLFQGLCFPKAFS